MKYFGALVWLLISDNPILFAGGAGSSSKDKYLFYIPVILLVLLWAIPKMYKSFKTRGNAKSDSIFSDTTKTKN